MSESEPTSRKQQLLDAAIDELMVNGLSDTSLRELAGRLGTSHRILIYHFGSKENLINLAVQEVRRRERESFQARKVANGGGTRSLSDSLREFFDHNTSEGMRSYFRLLYEVWGRANIHPGRWQAFLDGIVVVWVDSLTEIFIEAGYDENAARSRATLVLAALRGLQLDLFTTNDEMRVRAAFDALVELILVESSASPSTLPEPHDATP